MDSMNPEEVSEAARLLAGLARYRQDMKAWSLKAKLKARKHQGGRRDHWAELHHRDGPPRTGFKITPDHALSHKVKINRTASLVRAEERRSVRIAQHPQTRS